MSLDETTKQEFGKAAWFHSDYCTESGDTTSIRESGDTTSIRVLYNGNVYIMPYNVFTKVIKSWKGWT